MFPYRVSINNSINNVSINNSINNLKSEKFGTLKKI